MRIFSIMVILASLVACNGDGDDKVGLVDADGDGFSTEIDCDDSDASVHPGADEVCDAQDNDCDDLVDEEAVDALTLYADVDGDGYGDPASAVSSCDILEDYVEDDTDCDDARADVNPEGVEVCDEDDVDEDCDGLVDDADDSVDAATKEDWYLDADRDGYGALGSVSVPACDDPSEDETTYSLDDTDCDDERSDVNPGATEVCDDLDTDEDCDGKAEDSDDDNDPGTFTLYYVDADQDGFGDMTDAGLAVCDDPSTATIWYATDNTDCDDAVASTYPGATETTGDEVDSDCDGREVCFVDADEDGYAAVSGATVVSPDADCQDSGEASLSDGTGDCDDAVASTYPGATETTGDEVDSDCDGGEICFVDADNDSYVVSTGATVVSADADCQDLGEGSLADGTGDCDDAVASTYPGATETTGDEVDSDCDGGEVCYADADDDGYAASSGATVVSADADCQDSGEASGSEGTGDCDDTVATTYPGATEGVGDEVDSDCDGGEICYVDADDDSYRTDSTVTSSDVDCTDSGEAVATEPSGDCDDADLATYPGATEVVADGKDQSCDGREICHVDGDDDGYRLARTTMSSDSDCSDSGEALASEPTGDCNDANAKINPGETEICDGLDNDCDASTSEDGSGTYAYTDFSGNKVSGTFAKSFFSGSASSPLALDSWGNFPDYEVTLCKGTYYLNVTNTTLKGGYGFSLTGITGKSNDVVISSGTAKGTVFELDLLTGATVSLQDLTIQDGHGTGYYTSTYVNGGGGVNCNSRRGETLVSLENVVLKNNTTDMTSGYGAALATYGCVVKMKDVEVSGNSGAFGAVAVFDTDADFENVTIENNEGTDVSGLHFANLYYAPSITMNDVVIRDNHTKSTTKAEGAVWARGRSSYTMTLEWDDVLVEDNTSSFTDDKAMTGLYLRENVDMTWTGLTASSSGTLGNRQGVNLFHSSATLDVQNVDFGKNGSSEDNIYGDVVTNDSRYWAPNGADFICNGESCSTDSKVPDGDPTNDEYVCTIGRTLFNAKGVNRGRGNIVQADRNSTIESFDVFLDAPSYYCDFDYYILERAGTSGAWTVLWSGLSKRPDGIGPRWHNSGQIGVPVKSGMYYGQLVTWSCLNPSLTVTYYYGSRGSNTGFGDGSTLDGYIVPSYGAAAGYKAGDTYNPTSATTSAMQTPVRFYLNDVETTSTSTCIP